MALNSVAAQRHRHRDPDGRQRARRRQDVPELRRPMSGGFQDQRAERQQHDRSEIEDASCRARARNLE